MVLEVARSSFYRKSRRGQVIQLVRDKYLKGEDDIGFGFLHAALITLVRGHHLFD